VALFVSLSTVLAVVLARALLPSSVWTESPRQLPQQALQQAEQQEAIALVEARLGGSPAALRLGRTLRSKGFVTPTGPHAWTVRLSNACWRVHELSAGEPTLVAEPENAAARSMEALAKL
jgi:hypothetical protein